MKSLDYLCSVFKRYKRDEILYVPRLFNNSFDKNENRDLQKVHIYIYLAIKRYEFTIERKHYILYFSAFSLLKHQLDELHSRTNQFWGLFNQFPPSREVQLV